MSVPETRQIGVHGHDSRILHKLNFVYSRGSRSVEVFVLESSGFRLQQKQELKSAFVFTSERGAPFSTAGFLRMVQRVGEAAKLGFPVHPTC